MLKTNSFTYTVCSRNYVNKTAGVPEWFFDFDRLPQSEYFVQCVGFIIVANNLINAPFIINLVATDLADNRNYTAGVGSLQTNQIVLATIPTTVNSGANLQSGEGSVFTVRNMDMGKRVKFSIHGNDMALLTDAVVPDAAYHVISFQFTPIN